jgi:hypothetical protein
MTHSETSSVDPVNLDPIIVRGREAWSRLRKGQVWDDWLVVGEALHLGRHLAMLEAHTNEPSGSRYNAVYGEWLQINGFNEIDKGVRSRLFDCLQRRSEIEAWRSTLPLSKRLHVNHPNTIWRNWQKATVAGKATANSTAQLSPIAKLKQEVMRLEDENLQLRRAGDDLFSSRDSAADIARLIADRLLQRLTPTKVHQVLEQLPQVVTERAELPREAVTADPPKRGKRQRRTIEDFQRGIAAKHKAAEAAP